MTHNQALTVLADAVEQLDRDQMHETHHIAVPGGEGYMIMTRELYAKMVKRIYDLQRPTRQEPTDEEIRLMLAQDPRTKMN